MSPVARIQPSTASSHMSNFAPPVTQPKAFHVPEPMADIYLFDDQGSAAATSPHTVATALRDAEHPLGRLLLSACHVTFLEELQLLSQDDKGRCGLNACNFASPTALLDIPSNSRSNSLLALISLYTIHLLRFVAHEHRPYLLNSSFQHPASAAPVFLGFSIGQLAATVIAASDSTASFLGHALQVFRFAFFLGYRVHQWASSAGSTPDDCLWSLVLIGCSKAEGVTAIRRYNDSHPESHQLYLTAVTHATCVTVSGFPDAIREFDANYRPPTVTSAHRPHIYALYHSPALSSVKPHVMQDLEGRLVRFPTYQDLKRPLRSSVDGSLIDATHHCPGRTLAELTIDTILLHPVDFERVLTSEAHDHTRKGVSSVRLISIGPGTGLSLTALRTLEGKGLSVGVIDWSPASTVGAPNPPAFRALADAAVTLQKEPIAIVGMAVNFPGASNASEFWKVLEKGLNTVTEIPSHRFDIAEYVHAPQESRRKLCATSGNFLEDADVFDNSFFRVSPREALNMDPQQRVLLRVAYHALEDAGYVPEATPTFDPGTFAVYVGAATNDYVHNLRGDIDVYYSTGTIQAFLSGKISYALGFGGPSIVVDTACSSAVVAIHQACRALQARDCNAALAGGVNVITSPDTYIGLDRAHFLSESGQCRPWDAAADGYCRAEGCGMFVLKRLSDALAEHDRILGVIRGVEINQSGQADSITRPHVPTQVELFNKALGAAGVDANDVSVVEAHGTGTQAGDPAEMESLQQTFGGRRAPENVLHVTSVKANIGHAEAASGAASLAKLVLMMRHGTIPATISLRQLNPRIAGLEKDAMHIDREPCGWRPPGGRRRLALLNNFGAAGSNAALILEEPPAQAVSDDADAPGAVVLGLSCDTAEAVEELRERYLSAMGDLPDKSARVLDFAYAATARRQLHRYRVAASGGGREELCRNLRAAPVTRVGERRRKVVFLFSGQGGQYLGMGAGLYKSVPSFRRFVDECDGKVVSWGFNGIVDVVKGDATGQSGVSDSLEASHCALFVLECALAVLWRSWGLEPDVVIGHSLGEYAALVCANVVNLDDALRFVAQRARLTSELCERAASGMLAVRADPDVVSAMIRGDAGYEELSIACFNSDADCVVGGAIAQIELLEKACQRSSYPCGRLDVPYAYHTPFMDPIVDELRRLGQSIDLRAPEIPLVSTVQGNLVSAGDRYAFTPDYFARHCKDAVLFQQGIRQLLRSDSDAQTAVWLEIGPHSTTSPLLRANGVCEDSLLLSSLRRHHKDEDALCSVLSQLYCSGTSIDWRRVFADLAPQAKMTELPLYPFAKTRFWVPYTETPRSDALDSYARDTPVSGPLVGDCVDWPAPGSSLPGVFEVDLHQLAPFMDGHRVVGHALCPASVYGELVLAASRIWCERIGLPAFASALTLSDITFEAPLLHSRTCPWIVRIEVTPKGDEGGFNASFSVNSRASHLGAWQTHCTGTVAAGLLDVVEDTLSHLAGTVHGCLEDLQIGSRNTRSLYGSTIYNEIFSRVVSYSDAFRTIKAITVRCDGADAYALVQSPPTCNSKQFVVDPIFMDTLLHVAGFLLNLEPGDADHVFICSHVQKVNVLSDPLKPSAIYGVYCQVGYLSQTMAIADAYAVDLEDGGQIIAHMSKIQFRRLSVTGFKAILSMSMQEPMERTSPSTRVPVACGTPRSRRLLEGEVSQLIADACGIPASHLNPQSRLQDLGVDSLMSIELVSQLKAVFPGIKLSSQSMSARECVTDLVNAAEATFCSGMADKSDQTGVLHPIEQEGREPSALSLTQVAAILSDVLSIPEGRLSVDAELNRLGLDSLSSIETRYAFKSVLDIDIPRDVFSRSGTIRELWTNLANCADNATLYRPADDLGINANPMLLQNGGSPDMTPLVLIHDGSGMIHPYLRLHNLNCDVWGVHNPRLSAGGEWEGGVLEAASHYASLIRAALGEHGCILGGWSFGGVVAFEIARQLLANGVHVKGLVLIDSPHPQMDSLLPDSVIDIVVRDKVSNMKHAELVRLQMRHASRALQNYDPSQSPASQVRPPRTVMLRSEEGYKADDEGEGTVTFLADRSDAAKSVVGWETLIGSQVPILDIPGNHFDPFEPQNVGRVTERLRQAITMFEEYVSPVA